MRSRPAIRCVKIGPACFIVASSSAHSRATPLTSTVLPGSRLFQVEVASSASVAIPPCSMACMTILIRGPCEGWPRTLGLEGIEAILFRTVGDQVSLFESVLPEEFLRLPRVS